MISHSDFWDAYEVGTAQLQADLNKLNSPDKPAYNALHIRELHAQGYLPLPSNGLSAPAVEKLNASMEWAMACILAAATAVAGVDRANDAAWDCTARPYIEFDVAPVGLNATHDYWLVAQTDSHYFVRDNATSANQPDYFAINRAGPESAHISVEPPTRSECSGTRWPF